MDAAAVTRYVVGEAAALLAYHTPHTKWQTGKGGKNQFAIRSNAQEVVTALSSEQGLERPQLLQSGPYPITHSDSSSWHGNICLQ